MVFGQYYGQCHTARTEGRNRTDSGLLICLPEGQTIALARNLPSLIIYLLIFLPSVLLCDAD